MYRNQSVKVEELQMKGDGTPLMIMKMKSSQQFIKEHHDELVELVRQAGDELHLKSDRTLHMSFESSKKAVRTLIQQLKPTPSKLFTIIVWGYLLSFRNFSKLD